MLGTVSHRIAPAPAPLIVKVNCNRNKVWGAVQVETLTRQLTEQLEAKVALERQVMMSHRTPQGEEGASPSVSKK
jgi:hypothetical protein